MSAGMYPYFNMLKKKSEDGLPEQKVKHKRKRMGEMYVTTDKLDRLSLQASTFEAHSDESDDVLVESECFNRLPNRSRPSIHLCWQFDETHPSEEKSAELIKVISKVVTILKGLDREDDDVPAPAYDTEMKSKIPSSCVHVDKRSVSLGKEPLTDHNRRKNQSEEHIRKGKDCIDLDLERILRSKSRPKYRANKGPGSTSEETRYKRNAGEYVCPSMRFGASESRRRQFSKFDSGLRGTAFNSVHQVDHELAGDYQQSIPNETKCASTHQRAPRRGPAEDVQTPLREAPESVCDSEREFSDCEDVDVESTCPVRFNTYRPCESDEEDGKSTMSREVDQGGNSDPKTRNHGFKVEHERTVKFASGERHGAASRRFVRGESSREKLHTFARDLKEESPANGQDCGGKTCDSFLEPEDINESSFESSDDDLLYEDEHMFHDCIREPNRKTSGFPEEFIKSPSCDPNFSKDQKSARYSNLKEPRAGNRQRISKVPHKLRYEIITLQEVDSVFSGPNWKAFDPRLRVKTILDQFHYLVRHYRSEASKRARVDGRRSRPDVQAGKYLMSKQFCFNQGWSMVGNIPGVEVGDTFSCREELLILIVHRTSQAGIDFIPAQKSGFFDKDGNPAAVAVSVVSAGGYRDTEDNGETLIYVGSGGDKNLTNRRCPARYKGIEKDQELVRGNLALKNSCDLGIPVRVIRGEKYSDGDLVKKSYWFDGLYDVVRYFDDKGSAGSKVWKFRLVKQKGQRES